MDFRSPLHRDFELESTQLGPSTRVFQVEVDPLGGVFYQLGKRFQCIQLPQEYAHRKIGVIDMIRVAGLVELQSRRMIALAVFMGAGKMRLFLMGRNYWGRVLDEGNREQPCPDIPALLRAWKIPVLVHDLRNQLTLDIQVNIHNREAFIPETRSCFRDERMAHFLQMGYLFPSGQYFGCRLDLREPRSGRSEYFYDLEEFPFLWPTVTEGAGQPAEPEPPPAEEIDATTLAAERPEALRGSQVIVPDTTGLSLAELIEVLSLEHDAERLWQMIEPNLKLARPERTYQMLLHHGELIAQRTRDWPPARLKTHLGFMPGSVLTGIMHTWFVNQVLAIADGNAENQRIMQWLREHEVERLMNLNLSADLSNAEQARGVLRIDHHADQAAVRRTWRTLVAFLNADYGRSEERPIHRHKDEVVKILQLARDILLRGMK